MTVKNSSPTRIQQKKVKPKHVLPKEHRDHVSEAEGERENL